MSCRVEKQSFFSILEAAEHVWGLSGNVSPIKGDANFRV